MREKAIGYISFFIGIAIMVYSIFQVYYLLTNKTKPFEVFINQENKSSQTAFDPADLLSDTSAMQEMQTNIITSVMDKQINKSLNMASTMFFYYFLMLFGFRLSQLGVQLVRPIKVQLRPEVVKDNEGKIKLNTTIASDNSRDTVPA